MENKSARAKVQAFGGFLTAMVIPNIGAFIAWGFITALFIPTGWLPNEHFAKIVGPMITYLLPVMIGSTGGHLVIWSAVNAARSWAEPYPRSEFCQHQQDHGVTRYAL